MRFFGRKKKEEEEEKIPVSDLSIFNSIFEKAVKKRMEESSESSRSLSTKASEAEHSDTKEKKEEKKETKPLNRDDILLEILKELRELNSNVKAMIVRMDVEREENARFRENVIELLAKQVAKPF